MRDLQCGGGCDVRPGRRAGPGARPAATRWPADADAVEVRPVSVGGKTVHAHLTARPWEGVASARRPHRPGAGSPTDVPGTGTRVIVPA